MTELKIVTWNCNGAFRKKFTSLAKFDADILVIQECEDPAQTQDVAYRDFAQNYLWLGPTKNKGLGVFARRGVQLSKVELELESLELFLPVLVNGQWPLLACWTRQANSPTFRYIGQLWKLLQKERSFLASNTAMLIGDLNSNSRWDEWDRWWNHSDVVRELQALGLSSAYHRHFSERQGEESKPTLFLQRKIEKPYHIDYGFFGPSWEVNNVEVGEPVDWLEYSDHMPLRFNLIKEF